MNQQVFETLWTFLQTYLADWQQRNGSLPQTAQYLGLSSPCIVKQTPELLDWQPVKRDSAADFSNIEAAMSIALHPDIADFYAHHFAADIDALWHGQKLTLIQVWNEDDFVRLQQNILGHWVMLKRLKQSPTVFIASLEREDEVISVCNQTGVVFRETLGKTRQPLADSLCEFLHALTPAVSICAKTV